MKQILVTADGTLVNPSQITTAKRSLDQAGYQKDSFAYFRGKKEISAVEGEEREQYVLRKTMTDLLDKQFPKGKPEVEDYYRTQIRLSDGQVLWVEQSMTVVRFLMERG